MRDVGTFVEGVPDADLDAVRANYLEPGGEFLVGDVDTGADERFELALYRKRLKN